MQHQAYHIPSATDRQVIDTFAKVAKVLGVPQFSGHTFAQVNFACTVDAGPDEALAKILEFEGRIINHASVGTQGISIGFYRGGPNDPNASDSRNTALWDKLTIAGSHEGSQEKKLEAVSILLSGLRPYELGRTPTSLDAQTTGELVAIHTSILEKLEHTNATVLQQTTTLQQQLRSDSEALIAEERKKVEAWRDEVAGKLDERERGLEAIKLELDEARKRIDDKSNTYARRELRDKMLAEVKERVDKFGVSQETEKKRKPVFWGMVALIIVMLVYSLNAFVELYQIKQSNVAIAELAKTMATMTSEQMKERGLTNENINKIIAINDPSNNDKYWVWLRVIGLALGTIGAVVYYIRWQDRWASQHALAEMQLRQFHLDVSRANWIIESGLEWKKETDDPMPDHLVEHISHGLFVKESEPAQVLHPADELASALLGNASKLNLRTPMGELEFKKPGKIPKTTES